MIAKMSWRSVFAWALLVAWLGLVLVWAWPLGNYTPDSFSYLDMAFRIQEGHPFHVDGVRQFQTEPGVAASFPIGFPLLLALAEWVVPVGVRIGLVVNVAALLVAAWLLDRSWSRGAVTPGMGPIVILALSLFQPFTQEIAAARSMPVAVLVIVAVVVTLRGDGPRRWLIAGTLVGVSGQIRFDLFLVLLVVVVGVWLAERDSRRWPSLAVGVGAAAAVTIAAAAWGVVATGEFVGSDNTRTILSAPAVYVRDYFIVPPPNLFDAPSDWLARLGGNTSRTLGSLRASVSLGLLPLLVILAWRRDEGRMTGTSWLFLVTATATTFALMLTTGYYDLRYWTPTVLGLLLVTASATRSLPTTCRILVGMLAATVIVPYAVSGLAVDPARTVAAREFTTARGLDKEGTNPSLSFPCVGDGRIMFFGTGIATRVAALGDVETSAMPSNLDELTEVEQQVLVDEFGITHIHGTRKLRDAFKLASDPAGCDGVLRIVRP